MWHQVSWEEFVLECVRRPAWLRWLPKRVVGRWVRRHFFVNGIGFDGIRLDTTHACRMLQIEELPTERCIIPESTMQVGPTPQLEGGWCQWPGTGSVRDDA